MRQQARRESARAWVASGAPVSVKAFARRHGVDCDTPYADLIAIGFCLASASLPATAGGRFGRLLRRGGRWPSLL